MSDIKSPHLHTNWNEWQLFSPIHSWSLNLTGIVLNLGLHWVLFLQHNPVCFRNCSANGNHKCKFFIRHVCVNSSTSPLKKKTRKEKSQAKTHCFKFCSLQESGQPENHWPTSLPLFITSVGISIAPWKFQSGSNTSQENENCQIIWYGQLEWEGALPFLW